MGFVFSMADPSLSVKDETDLINAITASKSVGNFESLFINNRISKGDAEKEIIFTPVFDITSNTELDLNLNNYY